MRDLITGQKIPKNLPYERFLEGSEYECHVATARYLECTAHKAEIASATTCTALGSVGLVTDKNFKYVNSQSYNTAWVIAVIQNLV